MTSGDIVLLVVVILVATLVPIAVALWYVRRAQKRRLTAMAARFPNALLVEPALFYGQESSGATQLRGNGVLALLPDRLHFEMLTPRREFTIPLDRITAIESPTSFLGKTNFKPLLKIVYLGDTGKPDSMAWLVDDVAVWQARLSGEAPSM